MVSEALAGISCPAGDARALAEAIASMAVQSESARAEMGDNARRYALTHFSLDRLTAELAEHFHDMVGARTHKTQENGL